MVCLATVAGYLNAVGFLDLGGIYPAAMTGNTTQLGIALGKVDGARIALVGFTLLCFFCGGLFSSFIQRRLANPGLELVMMAVLILIAQFVRFFASDTLPLELPLLACAMAMQGETVSRFGGTSLQTVVVTNNLLKFASGIVGRYLYYPEGRTHLLDVILPGSAWLAYLAGAAFGVLAHFFLPVALSPPIFILLFVAGDLQWSGASSRG